MQNVYAHDKALVSRCLEEMKKMDNVEIYGSPDARDRLSVITFNVKDMGCHGIAKVLNLRGNVMIRSGFHCAQPLRDMLGVGPRARASFYLYNAEEEIDVLAELLGKLAHFM